MRFTKYASAFLAAELVGMNIDAAILILSVILYEPFFSLGTRGDITHYLI